MNSQTRGQMIRKRRRQRKKRQRLVLILGILFILLISTAAALSTGKAAAIQVAVKSEAIIQEEALPQWSVDVTLEDKKKESKVIDRKSKYAVSDLVKDLKEGIDYTIVCETDGTQEGDFPIQIQLSDELKKKLEQDWRRKVKVEVKEGVFTVKNKVGEWDGTKFKKWDGTYLANEFVTYKGKVYFLGENQERVVSGFNEVNGKRYCFDKDGVMVTGWYDDGESKYHFGEDGAMTIGWLADGDAKYYFDKEGKMLTGDQRVGTKQCVFTADGKLESEKLVIDPAQKMVALTFDDGPGPRTMELLNVLEANGAKATFFMVGPNVDNYPDTVKKMEEIGCEPANHTTNHKDLAKLDAAGIQTQVGGTNNSISAVLGHGAALLRPPYGSVNDGVKAYAGMPLALWSVDTLDWKVKNKEQTVANIWQAEAAGGLDGDVILMHDIHGWSVDAAIEIIPQLVAKGYQLVTMSEMAEARGTTMEAGVKYFSFPQQ